MFVVLAERQGLYRFPNELEAYGPFAHSLQARDYATTHLHQTGDHCEVLELKTPEAFGEVD